MTTRKEKARARAARESAFNALRTAFINAR